LTPVVQKRDALSRVRKVTKDRLIGLETLNVDTGRQQADADLSVVER
jgi:hypothetical protein